MKRSSQSRKTAGLTDSLNQRLNMYAIAATAAGVLACASPLEAKIVYTKTHIKFGPNASIPLDLNHDGVNDFQLVAATFGSEAALFLDPSPKNDVLGTFIFRGIPVASALYGGASVGPNGHFFRKNRFLMAMVFNGSDRSSGFYGPWAGQPGQRTLRNRYLGFRFRIKGRIHYGWARLNVTSAGRPTGVISTLTGYAYETIPNKPLITGQTNGPDNSDIDAPSASLAAPASQAPTLGLLAAGAPALAIWRREELVAATQKECGT